MEKVELPHYALTGMYQNGVNGLFDFLRSEESIASRENRKKSRLEYREKSGQARRDTRFERGQIRREKRLVRAENRLDQAERGGSAFGDIVGGIFNLIKPKEQTTYPESETAYAQLDTTPQTNQAGGWIMAAVVAGLILGGGIIMSKKDKKSNKKA